MYVVNTPKVCQAHLQCAENTFIVVTPINGVLIVWCAGHTSFFTVHVLSIIIAALSTFGNYASYYVYVLYYTDPLAKTAD